MRSSWAANILLPAAQVLAEGAWLAVFYAALQALTGGLPWAGPLELGALAWAGMAWGRRRRWLTPTAEAVGLPLLALAAGAFGWMLDPDVRFLIVRGDWLGALGTHAPGWIGAIAFWRGEVHRSREDDDAIQDQLLRWAVPGLAIPWAIGHLASSGDVELEFRAAAFVGTIFFVGSAFTAMGLARLEAVRASTGSDWRANRSWLVLVIGLAVGLTAFAVPAASLLGVPARALLVATLGPLQTLLFVLLLVLTPVIVLAAAAADLLSPLLPAGFSLSNIKLPDFGSSQREIIPGAPTMIFYGVLAILFLLELLVLAGILYLRWQERRRLRAVMSDPFEERSIVIPPRDEVVPPPSRIMPRGRRHRAADPVGAYLSAMDLLDRDGRWPRDPAESPAAHTARLRRTGVTIPGLVRLADAYQLARYGERELPPRERARTGGRLAALRTHLRRV